LKGEHKLPTVLSNILSIIVVLGVLIFFHELGHFIAAKLVGVKVLVFSLGFGPRLIGFQRKKTDYRISLIPLGGYVRMFGDNPMEQRTGTEGEFLSKSRPARFLILIMGATFNILLAVGVLTIVLYSGIEMPAYLDKEPVIGAIIEDSPASKVDIKPGDKILTINNKKVNNWEDLTLIISTSPNKNLKISLERQGSIIERNLIPEEVPPRNIGYAGLVHPIPPLVENLQSGFPAEKAGLINGDLILKIDDIPVTHFFDLHSIIQEKKGQALNFTIKRKDKIFTIPIKPIRYDGTFRIGVEIPWQLTIKKLDLPHAFEESLRRNYRMTFLTIEVLEGLISRKLSLRTLSGPIDIARFSGAAARMGIIPLLEFIALVSLQLGILNLLPIPILDGGHILILMVESIVRKDISLKVKEKILQAGFAFLVLLTIVVIYLDIVKNF
jgi:regulator of sigma E protease